MSWAILIPLSIGMGLIGLVAFIWALYDNQFEDPEGNAARILLDTPPQAKGPKNDTLASDTDH